MAVVNIYAPQEARAWKKVSADKAEAEKYLIHEFYSQLEQAVTDIKKNSNMFVIAGDFNRRIGRARNPDEEYMGKYGIGRRNPSGEVLADFVREQRMICGNTMFKHRISRRFTWEGNIRRKEETATEIRARTQIDYMLVHRRYRLLLTNARAYYGTGFQSDHGLLIAHFNMDKIYIMEKRTRKEEDIFASVDINALAKDEEIKTKYQQALDNALQGVLTEME